jgi:hypothetical protein
MVPPVLDHDFEGGTGSIAPWIRKHRKFHESKWTVVSQEEREFRASLLSTSTEPSKVRPRGLVDVIYYDCFNPDSYDHFIQQIGNTPTDHNTVAIDSLQELSFDIQTFSKKQKGMAPDDLMHVKVWGQVQERNAIALRRLRDYRLKGIFVYLIASEAIDKAYVTDPRSTPEGGGQTQEPYTTKGTINVPGQLTGTIPGLLDVLLRTRTQNGMVTLVRKQEPIGPGVSWETKDRYGRLPDYLPPSFYTVCTHLYGKEGATKPHPRLLVELHPLSSGDYLLVIQRLDKPSLSTLSQPVSRSGLFLRVQEHVNNAVRNFCNEVELEHQKEKQRR